MGWTCWDLNIYLALILPTIQCLDSSYTETPLTGVLAMEYTKPGTCWYLLEGNILSLLRSKSSLLYIMMTLNTKYYSQLLHKASLPRSQLEIKALFCSQVKIRINYKRKRWKLATELDLVPTGMKDYVQAQHFSVIILRLLFLRMGSLTFQARIQDAS